MESKIVLEEYEMIGLEMNVSLSDEIERFKEEIFKTYALKDKQYIDVRIRTNYEDKTKATIYAIASTYEGKPLNGDIHYGYKTHSRKP